MTTPLLRTTARTPGEACRHDALDFVGGDLWRCRLCGKILTGLKLIEEKQARHNKKTPGALTPGDDTETENTKEQTELSIAHSAPNGKGGSL